MRRSPARLLGGIGALATVVGALASAGPALATTTTQTISSAGPLTGIVIGNDLDCQVQYAGWTGGAFYPPASLGADPATGDCGTFVSVGASIYGPDFDNNYASGTGISLTTAGNYVPFTPGAQSAVSGAGTAASPYVVTGADTAGTSGINVSESDRYVTGQTGFTTVITLTNTSAAPVSGLVYRAVDCYLEGSDNGYGETESDGGIVCSSTADDSAGGSAEELDPLTAGSHYVETYFDTLWGDLDAQTDLPDSCDCTTYEDNALGLNWDFTLAPGASTHYTVATDFTAATGSSGSSGSSGSGSGSSPTSGKGNETGHGKVRISLRETARHHRAGTALVLPAGFTGERVRATLHGADTRAATGTITYDLYRGRRCTAAHRVVRGRRRRLRHGRVPVSAPVTTKLRAGRYSWQASYSGDPQLAHTKSACGSARVTIRK